MSIDAYGWLAAAARAPSGSFPARTSFCGRGRGSRVRDELSADHLGKVGTLAVRSSARARSGYAGHSFAALAWKRASIAGVQVWEHQCGHRADAGRPGSRMTGKMNPPTSGSIMPAVDEVQHVADVILGEAAPGVAASSTGAQPILAG